MLKFQPVPNIHDRQVWRWRQNRGEAMVEFLTPAFGDECVKPLLALGVSVQALMPSVEGVCPLVVRYLYRDEPFFPDATPAGAEALPADAAFTVE